jgi:LysM repeat protein
VAFEDDRDERASVPDHRHRCYADARPAPRALAHQEAYCLSSAFPVCPTFQDWARREAARSRDGAPTAPSASAGMNRAATGAASDAAASTEAGDAAGASGAADGGAAAAAAGALGSAARAAAASRPDRPTTHDAPDETSHPDDSNRRNPPRDWSAPPPWLASDERRRVDADPPPFLGRRVTDPGRGLAGSPADRLAGGAPPPDAEDPDDAVWSRDSRSAAAVGAGLAADRGPAPARRPQPRHDDGQEEFEDDDRRPARRPRAYSQHLGGPDGPDWERPRRYEAYPTIRSRVGLPAVPRLLGLVGLVAILALALFFLPGILNLGGSSGTPGSSPRASSVAAPSASLAPTVPPAPTPSVYTIKKGETLSKIAKAHGITIEELLAANPKITNPNRISEGQQIIIPVPSEAPPDTIGESAAP